MRRLFGIALWLAAIAFPCIANAEDQIIYRYRIGDGCSAKKLPETPAIIFDGKFGPLAKFQAAAEAKLKACATPLKVTPDGFFGCGLRQAISKLTTCPQVKAALPAGTNAAQGDLTEAMWRAAIADDPPPSMEARVKTMVLSFERTGYDRIEWNFCQYTNKGKETYNPKVPGSQCKSNDRNSFLTWGPRGATAGGGREIQNILSTLQVQQPKKLQGALDAQEADVTGLIGLSPCDTERYLCAKWLDPGTRDQWAAAFKRLSLVPEARQTFDDYYASDLSDGPKVNAFFDTYKLINIKPTQIDFAFFIDRATQTTGLPDTADKIADQIAKYIGAKKDNWRVRRAISVLYPSEGDQQVDRLGRDVSFFVDAVGETNLSAGDGGEDDAWQQRGAFKASDFGLSDSVFVQAPDIPKALDPPKEGSVKLPQGLRQCPAEVLLRRNKAGIPKPKNACL